MRALESPSEEVGRCMCCVNLVLYECESALVKQRVCHGFGFAETVPGLDERVTQRLHVHSPLSIIRDIAQGVACESIGRQRTQLVHSA